LAFSGIAPAAQALVGGDHQLAAAVGDAVGDRVRREAAEHHRMDRADARAGQHRDHRLGDHRQVDGDPVALADAEVAQRVAQPAHAGVQFAVADALGRQRGVVALEDQRRLVAARGKVPVQAVDAGVELAVAKPADVEVGRVEAGLADAGRRGYPVDPSRDAAPERVRVAQRVGVQARVISRTYVCRGETVGDRDRGGWRHRRLSRERACQCAAARRPPRAVVLRPGIGQRGGAASSAASRWPSPLRSWRAKAAASAARCAARVTGQFVRGENAVLQRANAHPGLGLAAPVAAGAPGAGSASAGVAALERAPPPAARGTSTSVATPHARALRTQALQAAARAAGLRLGHHLSQRPSSTSPRRSVRGSSAQLPAPACGGLPRAPRRPPRAMRHEHVALKVGHRLEAVRQQRLERVGVGHRDVRAHVELGATRSTLARPSASRPRIAAQPMSNSQRRSANLAELGNAWWLLCSSSPPIHTPQG
jgi:hypothetical protein